MINNNIISFDFDGSLSDHHNGDINIYKKTTQANAKLLISLGYEVHIVTRRYDHYNAQRGLVNEHLPVIQMAKELGIDNGNIHFTNRSWKYETIQKLGASVHIDDDNMELFWLERHCPGVKVFVVGPEDWQGNLLKHIEQNLIIRKSKESFIGKIKKILKKLQPFTKKNV